MPMLRMPNGDAVDDDDEHDANDVTDDAFNNVDAAMRSESASEVY